MSKYREEAKEFLKKAMSEYELDKRFLYEDRALNLYEKALDEAEKKDELRNLLSIIHKDGGHYIDRHGIDKAVAEAKAILNKADKKFDAVVTDANALIEIGRYEVWKEVGKLIDEIVSMNQDDLFDKYFVEKKNKSIWNRALKVVKQKLEELKWVIKNIIINDIFARTFYKKVKGKFMYVCKKCWNKLLEYEQERWNASRGQY